MTSWADLPVVKSLREEIDARSSKAEKGKERDGDHGEESHRMEGEKQGGEGGHVEKKFKRDTDTSNRSLLPSASSDPTPSSNSQPFDPIRDPNRKLSRRPGYPDVFPTSIPQPPRSRQQAEFEPFDRLGEGIASDLTSPPSTTTATSRKSQKLGPFKPDGAVTTISDLWVFGFREDKLHIWKSAFGLAWAHREGIYQSIFYLYLIGNLCGARFGMLVINTAFQRMVNLDDGVIAIETSTMSSLDLPYDDLTIDQLDDFIEFWKWIPNTMLVPNTDLKPTLAADPKANSHTNPHPDLNPDPNITPDAKPNANAEVHPKDGTLQFLESAQKRYIRFFQSMYYVGAHADIPTIFQRSHRPLQKVPPGVPSKSMEEIMIHGPGSPTPISQAFEPLLSHFPPAPNPSLSKVATADCEHVVNRPSRMGWTYLPEVGDGSVAVAGLRKHHYAGLRSRAREEGRKSMEKKKRMAKCGRRDDHAGGNEDGGREGSDSGGGPDDEAGDGDEDGDTAGDGEGEEGGRGGRRRDDAGAKDDGDSSDPITSTMDQGGRADTLRKTSLALVDPLRFPNIPPSSDELSFAEIDSLPSTPGLTRDSYPSDGGSSICTKLERYRNDLRGMGVSIKLVGPEQMDRIVHRITTGQVVTSSSVTTLDVLGDEGKTSLEESRDGGQMIKSTRWPNLNEYGVG